MENEWTFRRLNIKHAHVRSSSSLKYIVGAGTYSMYNNNYNLFKLIKRVGGQ